MLKAPVLTDKQKQATNLIHMALSQNAKLAKRKSFLGALTFVQNNLGAEPAVISHLEQLIALKTNLLCILMVVHEAVAGEFPRLTRETWQELLLRVVPLAFCCDEAVARWGKPLRKMAEVWVLRDLVSEESLQELFNAYKPSLFGDHFDRCLELFAQCVYDLMPPNDVPAEVALFHAAFLARCLLLDCPTIRERYSDHTVAAAILVVAINRSEARFSFKVLISRVVESMFAASKRLNIPCHSYFLHRDYVHPCAIEILFERGGIEDSRHLAVENIGVLFHDAPKSNPVLTDKLQHHSMLLLTSRPLMRNCPLTVFADPDFTFSAAALVLALVRCKLKLPMPPSPCEVNAPSPVTDPGARESRTSICECLTSLELAGHDLEKLRESVLTLIELGGNSNASSCKTEFMEQFLTA